MHPCQEFLTWIFLSGRETSTSRVPASSVLPLLSTLVLSFILKSLNHDLSLLCWCQIVPLHNPVEVTWDFCLQKKKETPLVSYMLQLQLPFPRICQTALKEIFSWTFKVQQNACTKLMQRTTHFSHHNFKRFTNKNITNYISSTHVYRWKIVCYS